MNLKLVFALFLCIFSCSVSYGLSCKDMLKDLYFSVVTIQTNAVMCVYRGYNNDGFIVYDVYYIDGTYQPSFGDWKLDYRGRLGCAASQDGNSSDCQFILKA